MLDSLADSAGKDLFRNAFANIYYLADKWIAGSANTGTHRAHDQLVPNNTIEHFKESSTIPSLYRSGVFC